MLVTINANLVITGHLNDSDQRWMDRTGIDYAQIGMLGQQQNIMTLPKIKTWEIPPNNPTTRVTTHNVPDVLRHVISGWDVRHKRTAIRMDLCFGNRFVRDRVKVCTGRCTPVRPLFDGTSVETYLVLGPLGRVEMSAYVLRHLHGEHLRLHTIQVMECMDTTHSVDRVLILTHTHEDFRNFLEFEEGVGEEMASSEIGEIAMEMVTKPSGHQHWWAA